MANLAGADPAYGLTRRQREALWIIQELSGGGACRRA